MDRKDKHTSSKSSSNVPSSQNFNSEKVTVVASSETQVDEMSLNDFIVMIQDWWKYFFSKWLIILIGGIIGAAIGLYYAYSIKPVYRAALTFVVEDEKSGVGLGGALGLASQFGFDVGGSGGSVFSGDNLLQLMRSRTMVEKALLTSVDFKGKTQPLAEVYIDINGMRKNWGKNQLLKDLHFLPNSVRGNFTRQQDSLLGEFYSLLVTNNLSVDKLDKKSSIISVQVKSGNELFSKYFSEVLVKEVSNFYVETKTKKSVQNLAILQHQTDSVRRALNSAITGVASSIDANPNPNISRQILRVSSQTRQVDVQANQAILTELVKNLEVSKVSLRKETPLIQVIDRPILPLDKEAFGKRRGVITGGLIGGFLIVGFLFLKKIFEDLTS